MSRTDADESDIEASRAPLLDHLIELRSRLIICVVAFLAGFILCFAFSEPLYVFLVKPFAAASALYTGDAHGGSPLDLLAITAGLRDAPQNSSEAVSLIYTAPLEILFTKIKLAAFGAIVLVFPVLAWQVYRFVAPGLYRNERQAFFPFLLAAPLLFLLGSALVYYVMMPFVMWFSLSQQISGGEVAVSLLPRVSDYLNLITALLLAFGLCFQLPLVVTLLGLSGILSSKMLSEGRRYAIVGVVVIAAIVTPPDPISQLMLAIPLCLLYEVSIWCVRLIELRRKKSDEAEGLA